MSERPTPEQLVEWRSYAQENVGRGYPSVPFISSRDTLALLDELDRLTPTTPPSIRYCPEHGDLLTPGADGADARSTRCREAHSVVELQAFATNETEVEYLLGWRTSEGWWHEEVTRDPKRAELVGRDPKAAVQRREVRVLTEWKPVDEPLEPELVSEVDTLRTALSSWLTMALDGRLPTTPHDGNLLRLRDWIDGGALGEPPEPEALADEAEELFQSERQSTAQAMDRALGSTADAVFAWVACPECNSRTARLWHWETGTMLTCVTCGLGRYEVRS